MSQKRQDWWAVLLLSLLTAVVGFVLGAQPTPKGAEYEWLEDRYGPGKHSEYIEEWIVRDFFQDRRNGVFLDVGAADARVVSNTYYLERDLGWSGVAIDAQEGYRASYREHRPRTRFYSAFVSDTSDAKAAFYVTDHPLTASSDKAFAERWNQAEKREVPTIRLDDLLARAGLQSVDFVSMDVELAEPKALRGFDIQRFKPSLVCIEAHPEVRQEILDYFHANHYVVVGKYLRVEDQNLYFSPLGTAPRPFPPDVMRKWTRH